jgi:putative hydrolase of the HAD superfamily
LPIKAITFDFWSTLYQPKAVDYQQRLHDLKVAIEKQGANSFSFNQFEAAVATARETWNRAWVHDHRTLAAREWLAVILHQLELPLAPDHRQEIETYLEDSVLTNNRPSLAAEARPVLAELAGSYRLAIISDTGVTPGRALRQILLEDQLLDFFTYLTFSDEIGRSKPHPSTFLTTLERLGVSPAEAVHVGDLLRTDIAGAQGVGMRGVQYLGLTPADSQAQPETSIIPDAVIAQHTQLAGLLQRWEDA